MKKTFVIAALLFAAACADKAPEGSTPGDCEDGKDNDYDGREDCADDGCEYSDHCVALKQKAELEKQQKIDSKSKKLSKESLEPVKPEPIGPTIESDDILIQVGHNGKDITWNDAEKYCKQLKLLGKTSWRLPSEKEALKIVETDGVIKDSSYVMWTSVRKGKKRAVIVGITGGAVNDLGTHYKGQARARCVLDISP